MKKKNAFYNIEFSVIGTEKMIHRNGIIKKKCLNKRLNIDSLELIYKWWFRLCVCYKQVNDSMIHGLIINKSLFLGAYQYPIVVVSMSCSQKTCNACIKTSKCQAYQRIHHKLMMCLCLSCIICHKQWISKFSEKVRSVPS